MSLPILHRDIPVSDRAAQLLGITGTAALAGALFAGSAVAIPSILQAPASTAAKQWRKLYEDGKRSGPPTSVLLSIVFATLAFRQRDISPSTTQLYAAAAVLAPSIIPYTLTVMSSTNDELIKRSDEDSSTAGGAEATSRDGATKALIDRWATLNLGRAAILLTSAAIAAWASLSPVQVLGVEGLDLTSGANRLG